MHVSVDRVLLRKRFSAACSFCNPLVGLMGVFPERTYVKTEKRLFVGMALPGALIVTGTLNLL